MTPPPDKPDPARGWQHAEKLAADEADRLATMSDEEFEREMEALPDPERVPTAEELLARGAARAHRQGARGGEGGAKAKVVALPPKKVHWGAWFAAAAVIAIVIGLVLRGKEEVASPPPDRGGEPGLGDDAGSRGPIPPLDAGRDGGGR